MNFSSLYTQAGNTALVNDVNLAKGAVNDAIREIVTQCAWNFTQSTPLVLTGGQFIYPTTGAPFVTAPALKIHYIRYTNIGTNQAQIIYPVTVEELLELQASSIGITGYGACFAVGGLESIMFYPTPSQGDTAQFYYTADFADITVDATITPLIPDFLHYAIIWIAARNLAIVTNAALVGEFEPLAQAAIAKCREYANTWGSRRPQQARVGLPQGSRVRRDRSQYWSGDY